MDRGEGGGVDAAVVEDDLAGPVDQEGRVEIATRPFGRRFEHIAGDEDLFALGQLLQWRGQRTGDAGAGALDPLASTSMCSGGPCMANSGNTTRSGFCSEAQASSISRPACRHCAGSTMAAAASLAAWQARSLRI
jgi:hypothetical protein